MSFSRPPYLPQQREALVRTVEPNADPISAADVKVLLGIPAADTGSDALIESFIKAGTAQCEEYCGLALITQTWRLSLDRLPFARTPWWDGVRELAVTEIEGVGDEIALPRSPLQSVTSVSLFADDDTETEVDSAIYYVDTQSEPGRVVLRYGQVWPSIVLRPANGVQVLFVAGYGDAGTHVPAAIREGLKLWVAYMFEHRGACDARGAMVKSGAESLWKPYRQRRELL